VRGARGEDDSASWGLPCSPGAWARGEEGQEAQAEREKGKRGKGGRRKGSKRGKEKARAARRRSRRARSSATQEPGAARREARQEAQGAQGEAQEPKGDKQKREQVAEVKGGKGRGVGGARDSAEQAPRPLSPSTFTSAQIRAAPRSQPHAPHGNRNPLCPAGQGKTQDTPRNIRHSRSPVRVPCGCPNPSVRQDRRLQIGLRAAHRDQMLERFECPPSMP
jgi:hypothetical protein